MASRRTNTPSRHRPSKAAKAEPEPEADTEAENSAPRAKTPHRRRHDQVTETNPEAEIENETESSRAITAWHNRRPSQSTEADGEQEAENQPKNPVQPAIPTENSPAPRQWALYFANLVRAPFIPSFPCFSRHAHCLLLPFPPFHPQYNTTTHISDLGSPNLQL